MDPRTIGYVIGAIVVLLLVGVAVLLLQRQRSQHLRQRFGPEYERSVAQLGDERPQARDLLRELDATHPSRSTLEVKTRRLLVATGHTGFVREFPLEWNRRTYLFDFAFEREQTILEVNGRRWHDDASDYEHDNEKWSVPGRHGYRIVFATWEKVTQNADALLQELEATLAA